MRLPRVLAFLVLLTFASAVHADTLDITAFGHFGSLNVVGAPNITEDFSTSFDFNTSAAAIPGFPSTAAVSDMVFHTSGDLSGFKFIGEATFGVPGPPPPPGVFTLFNGYAFDWKDSQNDFFIVGVPFNLQTGPLNINFIGDGISNTGASLGESGNVTVSEEEVIPTPELSSGATLVLGLCFLFVLAKMVAWI